jgi:hypothetical protein
MLCKFCRAEKPNANSLRNHERLCGKNPARQISSWVKYNSAVDSGEVTKKNTNQFTAAEHQGREKPIVSEETRQKISKKATQNNLQETESTKQKRINTIMRRISEGTWHTHGRSKKVFELGVWFDSWWEASYAKHLQQQGILWERNRTPFEYEWEGKTHRYFPDFYLPTTDEYVEIKGREYPRDAAKWEDFPKHLRLTVLRFKDLRNAKII